MFSLPKSISNEVVVVPYSVHGCPAGPPPPGVMPQSGPFSRPRWQILREMGEPYYFLFLWLIVMIDHSYLHLLTMVIKVISRYIYASLLAVQPG